MAATSQVRDRYGSNHDASCLNWDKHIIKLIWFVGNYFEEWCSDNARHRLAWSWTINANVIETKFIT
jgi:hypothetical protein